MKMQNCMKRQTFNQLATDTISRQAAIELIHSLYPSAPFMRINRKRWEKKYKPYIEVEKALEQLPSAQIELTDNRAYEYLQSTEWMQNHDKEMYEMGLRERLADDTIPISWIEKYMDWLNGFGDGVSKIIALHVSVMVKRWKGNYSLPSNFFPVSEEINPSAQPDVIRCRDCKYYVPEDYVCRRKGCYTYHKNPDDFCSNAEVKDNG